MKQLQILALCLLLLLCGCAGNGETAQSTYNLYFLRRDFSGAVGAGALDTEPSAVTSDTPPREAAAALMEGLLNGPGSETLKSPFPAGTTLRSLELKGSRAVVDLSSEYRALSGVALTLADYAITLTLTQLPQISVVSVTVRGQELLYRDRQSFTARDVLLEPEGDVVGTVDARLFFPGPDGNLSEEARSLPLYEGVTQVETVVSALEDGPENRILSPLFPEGFRVRSVWQEGELCYVNLTDALLDTVPDSGEITRILTALDRSLCSLETVRAVRFLVDGEYLTTYGSVSLTEPYQTVETEP